MTERSPILDVIDRLCMAVQAGSAKSRSQLHAFVLGVIDTYDRTWALHLGSATSQFLASRPHFFNAPADMVRFTKRLRWCKFKTRAAGSDEELRTLLREGLSRFGDEYLIALARRIGDAMAALPTSPSNLR